MNKALLAIFFVFITAALQAQNPLNCGSGRYTNDVFTNVNTITGVRYGANTSLNYVTNTVYANDLKFDFYEPANDVAVKRPLVILMFGGAFITGQRSDLAAAGIALAKKGYAVATIDYRLVFSDISNQFAVFNSPLYLTDVVIKATNDLRAAIRFFKYDAATANTYKIDPTKIIIGGASAGAIAALHTAYIDQAELDPVKYPILSAAIQNNGGLEGNTDLPGNSLLPSYNSSGVIGVINIAGGIVDTSFIDANDPPIYSAQGTADEVVPYNFYNIRYGFFTSPTTLYGSNLITTRANNIGLPNVLLPIPGGNHQSPESEPYISQILTGSSAFVAPLVCNATLPVVLNSFTVAAEQCAPVLRWKTSTEIQNSYYEIETSADGVRFTAVARVASKNVASGAMYQYKVEGAGNAAWFRLKITDRDGSFTYSPVQRFNAACITLPSLYPNPARSVANLSGLQAGMEVLVMNAEGKMVYKQKTTGSILQLPLERFSNCLLYTSPSPRDS